MFDLGWLELIVIGIVALIVVGPKDLPGMFRTVGRFMGQMRRMGREFQRSMEQAADESGLRDATRDLKGATDFARSPTSRAKTYAKDLFAAEEKAMKDLEDEVAYAAEHDPVPAKEPAAAKAAASRAQAATPEPAAADGPPAEEVEAPAREAGKGGA